MTQATQLEWAEIRNMIELHDGQKTLAWVYLRDGELVGHVDGGPIERRADWSVEQSKQWCEQQLREATR